MRDNGIAKGWGGREMEAAVGEAEAVGGGGAEEADEVPG